MSYGIPKVSKNRKGITIVQVVENPPFKQYWSGSYTDLPVLVVKTNDFD